jgi:hypothetical protein
MTRADLRMAIAAMVIACGVNCSGVTEPSPVPGLSITSVGPSSGPASGGTSVTVNGHNFTPSVGIRFGSAPASVQFVDSTRVIAVTAPHAAGVVDVMVVAGGATTSLSDGFTYTN